MKRTARRGFGSGLILASAGAALLVAGAAIGPARAAETLRVGKASSIAFNFMPLDVGMQRGYFAKNGLKIEELSFGGSAKLQQAAVAGAVDIGLGAGTDISFLVKGAPEKAVGALALSPALFGIVVPYHSPIRSLVDLKGKRIGISTVGSLTQWLVLQLEKKEGWKPGSVTMITDGSSYTPQIAALKTGQVDAQVTGAALGWNLAQHKAGRLLAPASNIVGHFLMNVIFASDNMVKQHPEAVRAFLKGWYESVAYMGDHKAETVALARKIDHFSQEVQEKQYDAVMPSLSRDGTFPAEAVQRLEQSFVDLHILKKAPDMSKYLTTRFLPKHG